MKPIEGKLRAIRDKVIVCDMEFGIEKTAGGILVSSDDGKRSGIHPRWARVYAVGPEQHSVKEGQWVLLSHGRWSRGIEHLTPNNEKITIRMADNDAILLVSDSKPTDVMRSVSAEAGSNYNFNIPGA
jgi:co-chaperonin GroES (HSP10)